MVKDEVDVIAGTILHLAEEHLDGFIVADNGSTDGTRDLLADLANNLDLNLTVIDDPDPAYYQSEKMSRLAALAGEQNATWIVPFDADEIWVFRGERIGIELERAEADIVKAELFHHFPSAVDPPGTDPFRTVVWRQRRSAVLPKVAFRWAEGATIHQGNHGVTLPGSHSTTTGGLEVRHFPHRTVEQFVRKARNGAAAYRATNLPPDVGAHWRGYGDLLDRYGESALHDVFREHFWFLSPADAGMVLDPAPYMRWSQS